MYEDKLIVRKAEAHLTSCECKLVQIEPTRAREHNMELQSHLGFELFFLGFVTIELTRLATES